MRSQPRRSLALAVIAGLLLALIPATTARADELSDLEAQIARYEAELAAINSQQLSVESQIAATQVRIEGLRGVLTALNSQLLVNNARLSDSQKRLDTLVAQEAVLSARLEETQRRMEERQSAFASQVRVLDKAEQRNPLSLLITSHSFTQFLQRLAGIRQVADGTNQLALELRSDRDLLAAQRAELDRQRTEQAALVTSIEQERQTLEQEYAIQNRATQELLGLESALGQQQAQLLADQNSVSGALASAESQLTSLIAFSHGRGGNIVPPEYLANSWGNYYNQRDARWGNVYLGTSPYEVWEIGCLLTSVAMVYSHFGYRNVTPGVIAANPANFTSGGLLYNSALNVPGHQALINNSPTKAWIDSILAQGGTVIIGMYISTGGTHFVVVVGQNGPRDYWINDPWEENAMHVSYWGSPVTGPIYDAIGYL